VGIRDVAAAAGVSITTVSDALNGKGRLPDTTRNHVRETADRLGYRPSAAARTLRTGRSGLIGLMLTAYGEEPFTFTEVAYFSQVASAATATALERGYGLVILPAASPSEVWASVALDGAIVLDPVPADPVLAELRRRGVPVITDGREVGPSTSAGWVDNDHTAAVHRVLDHLAGQGARRVGLVGGTNQDSYTQECMSAYLSWCAGRGQEPVSECHQARDPSAAAQAAQRILRREPRPDAVFGIYDTAGTDLLRAARALDLSVPSDLLVACCSESEAYATTEPPVTTLSLSPRACGSTAVDLLIDAIEAPEAYPSQRMIPSELLIRASSMRAARLEEAAFP
jgi:DNA-binding LacI/PurR family transcriptional regulator